MSLALNKTGFTASMKVFVLSAILIVTFFTSVMPAEAAFDGQLVNCGSKTGSASDHDCTWQDLIGLANNIVNFIVFFATLCGVLAFCYAGFLYITAGGEGGKIEQAHGIFKSVIVGMMFILCGWLLIATILKILVSDSGDNANIGSFIDFSGVKTLDGQSK